MILLVILLALISSVLAACPAGYSYYSMTQKCYKVYNDASPFFAASDTCHDDGGSLASIRNAFENTYIANLVSNNNLNHWIGLTNMISGYDFEWLDKTPVKYTNWIPGEPNYDTSCVFMEAVSGYWASNNCRDFLPFICEYDPAAAHSSCPACPTQTSTASSIVTAAPTCPACPACATCQPQHTCPTPPPKPICDDGWKYYDHTDFCYYFGNGGLNTTTSGTHCFFAAEPGNVNNTQAQEICRQKGAYLASIHSSAEDSFILNGIYATGRSARTWIGLYRTGPNATDFANYDGTPVDYTHWAAGDPNNYKGDEYCSQIVVSYPGWPNGVWDDMYCDCPLPNYVCKKPSNKN